MSNQFQATNNFQLTFPKISDTVLQVQACNIPGLSADYAGVDTPFSELKFPGTKVNYSDFSIKFKLDVNFDSYFDIFNWMMGLYFPETFSQYAHLQTEDLQQKVEADLTLTLLNNSSIPNIRITYFNAFPVLLSEIDLESTAVDNELIDVFASFKYERFKIEKL